MATRVERLARKTKTTKATAQRGSRSVDYQSKLKVLRQLSSEFDAKRFAAAFDTKPRTDKGKRERAAMLKKVSSTFKRVKPFVHRVHKVVSPRSARNLEELRKYAGFPPIKGLKAIPVATSKPATAKVTFDRKGRVSVTSAGRTEKLFRFPHMPHDGEDAIEMVEKMVKKLPAGFYIIATRHHFLLGGAAGIYERERLAEGFRKFVYEYRASPEFLKLVYGLKWLAGTGETAQKRRHEMRTERGREKLERQRIREERAAREIAAMHKRLTGKELPHRATLPKLTKRARATGRR